MTSLRRYRDWAILAATGTAVLTGLIWLGLELFPLMSWDVYETGRLFIVAFLAAVLATVFGNARAYAKGKADGYQHGHDVGYQSGWWEGTTHTCGSTADPDGHLSYQLKFKTSSSNSVGDEPLGFPHSGSHIYTTE